MQLSSNPWVVDATSDLPIFSHPLHNVQMEWIEYTSSTHTLEVQDENGQVVWKAQGGADLETKRSGRVGWIEGVKVPTRDSNQVLNMQSGRLLVYFE